MIRIVNGEWTYDADDLIHVVPVGFTIPDGAAMPPLSDLGPRWDRPVAGEPTWDDFTGILWDD